MDMTEKHALRKGREACYTARDEFYQCMRASGTALVAGGAVPINCQKIRKLYESACLASWVRMFKLRGCGRGSRGACTMNRIFISFDYR